MRVSTPNEYHLIERKGTVDYYHLGIKTDDGKRVMVFLSTDALGFTGDMNKSKMWYYHPEKKREVKTSLTQLDRVVGQRF